MSYIIQNRLANLMNQLDDHDLVFLLGDPFFTSPKARSKEVATASNKDDWNSFRAMTDVTEGKDSFGLVMDVPGIKPENIKIDVCDGRLTISGSRNEEKRDDSDKRKCVERSFGSFTRSFTVPSSVDASKIAASHENGILRLTLPKRPEALPAPKVIPITSLAGVKACEEQERERRLQPSVAAAEERLAHRLSVLMGEEMERMRRQVPAVVADQQKLAAALSEMVKEELERQRRELPSVAAQEKRLAYQLSALLREYFASGQDVQATETEERKRREIPSVAAEEQRLAHQLSDVVKAAGHVHLEHVNGASLADIRRKEEAERERRQLPQVSAIATKLAQSMSEMVKEEMERQRRESVQAEADEKKLAHTLSDAVKAGGKPHLAHVNGSSAADARRSEEQERERRQLPQVAGPAKKLAQQMSEMVSEEMERQRREEPAEAATEQRLAHQLAELVKQHLGAEAPAPVVSTAASG